MQSLVCSDVVLDIRGDIKNTQLQSPTCQISWLLVVTEKLVISDTHTVVNHHSWAVEDW